MDDLLLAASHVALFLLQRKNDQFREGSWVFIARSEVAPCPVAVLEKFLKMGSHSKGSQLFRRIQSTRKGQVLKEAPMSYSRASKLVKKELKARVWTQAYTVFTASGQGMLRLRQHLRFLIACSRDREDGEVLRRKTIMSRSHWTPCCWLQGRFRAWVEDCVSSGLLMGEIVIDIGTFKA